MQATGQKYPEQDSFYNLPVSPMSITGKLPYFFIKMFIREEKIPYGVFISIKI
jgi:hypothetical protein